MLLKIDLVLYLGKEGAGFGPFHQLKGEVYTPDPKSIQEILRKRQISFLLSQDPSKTSKIAKVLHAQLMERLDLKGPLHVLLTT